MDRGSEEQGKKKVFVFRFLTDMKYLFTKKPACSNFLLSKKKKKKISHKFCLDFDTIASGFWEQFLFGFISLDCHRMSSEKLKLKSDFYFFD